MPLCFCLFAWFFRPTGIKCFPVVADCQTLSFSASFYKIRLDKNHSKST
jgi:hypothetical protein